MRARFKRSRRRVDQLPYVRQGQLGKTYDVDIKQICIERIHKIVFHFDRDLYLRADGGELHKACRTYYKQRGRPHIYNQALHIPDTVPVKLHSPDVDAYRDPDLFRAPL